MDVIIYRSEQSNETFFEQEKVVHYWYQRVPDALLPDFDTRESSITGRKVPIESQYSQPSVMYSPDKEGTLMVFDSNPPITSDMRATPLNIFLMLMKQKNVTESDFNVDRRGCLTVPG